MITRKEKKMLLYAAGGLSLVLVYFFIVAPGKEERMELKNTSEALEAELAQVKAYADEQAYYEEETAVMQEEIDAVLAQFPSWITEETAIMYADMLENDTDIYIPNISIGNSNYLYTLGEDSGETAENGVSLYGTSVVYTFTVPYDDMKKVVRTIQEDEERRNVETITLSYESGSGELVGNMTVNMYAVTGTGKEYVAPNVPSMMLGTDNIFGTVSALGNGDDADGEDTGDAEEGAEEEDVSLEDEE